MVIPIANDYSYNTNNTKSIYARLTQLPQKSIFGKEIIRRVIIKDSRQDKNSNTNRARHLDTRQ